MDKDFWEAEGDFSEVVEALREAQSVAVLTGAGVSQESGLQTCRDSQVGLWSQYKPEELATPQAFRANPQVVWDWYAMRRKKIESAKPNPGYYALSTMEDHISNFTLVTRNVDGLHQLAGSRNVIELHGNINHVKNFSPVENGLNNGMIGRAFLVAMRAVACFDRMSSGMENLYLAWRFVRRYAPYLIAICFYPLGHPGSFSQLLRCFTLPKMQALLLSKLILSPHLQQGFLTSFYREDLERYYSVWLTQ